MGSFRQGKSPKWLLVQVYLATSIPKINSLLLFSIFPAVLHISDNLDLRTFLPVFDRSFKSLSVY
jgi:hypothetical protein